jgi:hypothetical protein
MRNRCLVVALTLVAVLPTLAMAQAVTVQREGSWEFSVGAGGAWIDQALAGYLGSRGFSTEAEPSHIVPALALRLGYNINNNFGFSFGAGGATGTGVKYLTPFVAATYTVNLNAATSPFLTFGTQFTRVTGEDDRVTHPTWGAHLGLGLRRMLSDYLALRIEGRMGIEHYAELPASKTAYNSIATIGLSWFTAGRRAPAAPSCPACLATRVDTVRIQAPLPPPVPQVRERDRAGGSADRSVRLPGAARHALAGRNPLRLRQERDHARGRPDPGPSGRVDARVPRGLLRNRRTYR